VLTAHGDHEARRLALAAGAVAFLGKPFDPDTLLSAVDAALGIGQPPRP
jgi:FixJ family two-component response regulator